MAADAELFGHAYGHELKQNKTNFLQYRGQHVYCWRKLEPEATICCRTLMSLNIEFNKEKKALGRCLHTQYSGSGEVLWGGKVISPGTAAEWNSRTQEEREEENNKNLHVSGLMCHNEGWGEAVFVVEGAAPHWVAHSCDRSVTWRTTEEILSDSWRLLLPWRERSKQIEVYCLFSRPTQLPWQPSCGGKLDSVNKFSYCYDLKHEREVLSFLMRYHVLANKNILPGI